MGYYYFAYGSNLDLQQMEMRCPNSKLIGPGYIKGYRLDFTRFSSGWNCGVADVVIEEESEVWGLVFEIMAEDLETLDRYEGYPDAYTRFQDIVKINDGGNMLAWIYTVETKADFIPPSQTYLNIIKIAAQKFEYPVYYMKGLERIITKG